MLDCPYLLLITESRAVSMICGHDMVPSRVMRKFVCRLWLNEVSQQ